MPHSEFLSSKTPSILHGESQELKEKTWLFPQLQLSNGRKLSCF